MTDTQHKIPHGLKATIREYITHWTVAGTIVTVTGFAPDHLVAHVLHAVPEELSRAFPAGIDYRLVIVGLGVLMIAIDVMLRNRARSTASVPDSGVSASTDSQRAGVSSFSPPGRQSIAVLPFNNLSNDPNQAYFTEGLTASLTTDLSRISGLFVISSASTATLDGKTIDVRQIGRDLGVRYLLQGSVQRGADSLRVNARLVEAGTGAQLWSDRFDGEEADVFALQDQITARIANSIGREVRAMAATEAERRNTNPQAIDYLIRGFALADKPQTLETLREREAIFRKATALDSNNAEAWTQLGRAMLSQRWSFGSTLSSEQKDEKLREGRAAVEKALALNPNNALAHYATGILYLVLSNSTEAVRAMEVAVHLDRNSALAHAGVGIALLHLGKPREAIPWIEQAMRLDPLGPSVAIQQTVLGGAHLLLRRTDLAIEWLLKATTSNPKYFRAQARLAAAYAQMGDDAAARSVWENLLRASPNFKLGDDFRAPGPHSSEEYRSLYEQVILPAYSKAGIPL